VKPLKLMISAFGSYAKEEAPIDFSRVSDSVFLISGDTGAGKTTVFDAITFALYGMTSGGERSGNMMRSQYAAPSCETYVEFTFDYDGQIYTVHRNPQYQIEKTKKSGETKLQEVKEKVWIAYPDGTRNEGRLKEVNQEIIEIVGLDFHQFTQIAMIAQGDFMKLLRAKTEEKKKIFSRLFHTEICFVLEEKLKRAKIGLERELESNETLCRQQLWQAGLDAYVQEQSQSLASVLSLQGEDILAMLKEQVEECAADEKESRKRLEKIRAGKAEFTKTSEELDRVHRQLQKAEQELEKSQEEQKTLDVKLAKANNELNLAETELGKHQEEYRTRILLLQNTLPKYKESDMCRQRKETAHKQAMSFSEEEHTLSGECAALEEQIQILREYLAQYKDCEKELLLQTADEEKNRQRFEKINKLKGISDSLPEKAEAYGKAKERTLLAKEAYDKARSNADRAQELLLLGYAGIMAQDLCENAPCPVCGSTSHPNRAELSDEIPRQEEVELAKQRAEQAEQQFHLASQQAAEAKSSYENLRSQLENGLAEQGSFEADEAMQEKMVSDAQMAALANKLCEQAQHAWDDALSKKIEQEKFVSSYSEKLREEKTLSERLAEKRQAQEIVHEKRVEADKALAVAITSLENAREGLLFDSEAQAQTEKEKLTKELAAMEKSAVDARVAEQKLVAEKQQLTGRLQQQEQAAKDALKEYKKKQKAAEKVFGEASDEMQRSRMAELNGQEKEEEKRIRDCVSEITTKKSARTQLAELFSQRQELYRRLEPIEKLHSTVSGRQAGKTKLDFETYVQRRYLEQILYEANQRFLEMSGGQFVLKMKETDQAGQKTNEGLDLMVYSTVTRSSRDIATLSGGESFMAALCLALGLADVVKRAAGSIHLDMMFVDEGFGSLDDHARQQAVQMLLELTGEGIRGGRMIGIISHVAELKQQIGNILYVKKAESGSTICWKD